MFTRLVSKINTCMIGMLGALRISRFLNSRVRVFFRPELLVSHHIRFQSISFSVCTPTRRQATLTSGARFVRLPWSQISKLIVNLSRLVTSRVSHDLCHSNSDNLKSGLNFLDLHRHNLLIWHPSSTQISSARMLGKWCNTTTLSWYALMFCCFFITIDIINDSNKPSFIKINGHTDQSIAIGSGHLKLNFIIV